MPRGGTGRGSRVGRGGRSGSARLAVDDAGGDTVAVGAAVGHVAQVVGGLELGGRERALVGARAGPARRAAPGEGERAGDAQSIHNPFGLFGSTFTLSREPGWQRAR